MPASIVSDALAKLRHFSDSGDLVAGALVSILGSTMSAEVVTIGPVTSHVITVTGQIKTLDGTPVTGVQNVVARSYPPAGAGTMAMHSGGGTAKKGSASTEMWFVTAADGSFIVDVTDATAEVCLIRLETDNGETSFVALTFT